MNAAPATPRTPPVRIAVLICTYRRPDALIPCLEALARQTRLPDDVMLVVRPTDVATHAALEAHPRRNLPWRIVPSPRAGLVAARNAGLQACQSDIVAFCDDDTCAHPEWVARILKRFASEPTLGGVGGRDHCHDGTKFDQRRRVTVGYLQWFGRAIGNHHLGFGAPRRVHFLKGANMSFQMEAIGPLRFDDRLRGQGAQPHDDLAFSLAVARRGWVLVYDPLVTLDHYAYRQDQPRPYVATRRLDDPQAYADACYNYVLAIWGSLSLFGRLASLFWLPLVGMRVCPGLLQAVRLTPTQGIISWRKFAIAQRSVMQACRLLIGPGSRIPPVRLSQREPG